MPAMRKPSEDAGFRPPASRALGNERRSVAFAQLLASLALALSTLIAATVLTVGIARAGVVDGVIDHEGGLFGIALLLGIAFIGLGGFSLLPGHRQKRY